MAQIILLNKPFNVLCQFSDQNQRKTLANFILPGSYPGFYPAGRLDFDSEGLVILTDSGVMQHKISHPTQKLSKTYWVQVEGDINEQNLAPLVQGIQLKDGKTQPAKANVIQPQDLWERHPPIRQRRDIPTSWIELTIKEGKNRQVRRMTAAIGHPTLRLVRVAIGTWHLDGMQPGEHRVENIHLPKQAPKQRSRYAKRK